MADVAEKAFLVFLEHDFDAEPTTDKGSGATAVGQESSSAQLPLGAAVPEPFPSEAAAAPSAARVHNSQHQVAATASVTASAASSAVLPKAPAPAIGNNEQVAFPPELSARHVGFLGSLAHALVHLQKPSEGLTLLRVAANIMRCNPHSQPTWMGSPDPLVLFAHVLMDLVSCSPQCGKW